MQQEYLVEQSTRFVSSIQLNCTLADIYTGGVYKTPIDKGTVYRTQSRGLPTTVARANRLWNNRADEGENQKWKKKRRENPHCMRKGTKKCKQKIRKKMRRLSYRYRAMHIVYDYSMQNKKKRRQKFEFQHRFELRECYIFNLELKLGWWCEHTSTVSIYVGELKSMKAKLWKKRKENELMLQRKL